METAVPEGAVSPFCPVGDGAQGKEILNGAAGAPPDTAFPPWKPSGSGSSLPALQGLAQALEERSQRIEIIRLLSTDGAECFLVSRGTPSPGQNGERLGQRLAKLVELSREGVVIAGVDNTEGAGCLLYTSPRPRALSPSRVPT